MPDRLVSDLADLSIDYGKISWLTLTQIDS